MRFNHNFTSVFVLIFVLLIFLNCTSTQEDNSKTRDAIWDANKKFMGFNNQGNADGLASLYTENGQLLPPNGDFITGRQVIQEFHQGGMDTGIKSLKLETIEVEGMGKTAYEVGKYTLFTDGDQIVDTGKYVVIWKQVEGQWKMHRDIWNSSMPTPEQQ